MNRELEEQKIRQWFREARHGDESRQSARRVATGRTKFVLAGEHMTKARICVSLLLAVLMAGPLAAQRGRGGAPAQPTAPTPPGPLRVEELKREAAADVETMRVMTQQMVDQVFSYGELGFQEIETSRYLTGILEKNGFKIERGYAGIPTAWMAT